MTDPLVVDMEEINPPTLTFVEIYKQLLIHEDIYLDDINEIDMPKLRKGISNCKAKDNAKAREAGIDVAEDRTIKFEILEVRQIEEDNLTFNLCRVHIFFQEPTKIRGKIIPADKTL